MSARVTWKSHTGWAMHDLTGVALLSARKRRTWSVACPYMPAGMEGCGIRVLYAVSVAVRHSLTGDRNVTRALIFIDSGSGIGRR